ncbi:hypothetical protein B296_00013385 [Ensete ventricosum]|uniref:Uncharacterized protein n=1 Tax=Ensete ventricosum TaxID=4639 RepID=A0A426ZSI4_ENSVE|nr:hypothetical protein B296_00013385 [Ensete ventricosum]
MSTPESSPLRHTDVHYRSSLGTSGSAAGLGGSTVESTQNRRYRWFSRLAWAVQPLTTARNPGRWRYTCRSLAVQLVSATLDNLTTSLGLLSANSLMPSWQTLDTLGELPTHSKRVRNRIVRTTV